MKKPSNANAPVNLIHREDCLGILKAIVKQNARGEVFNGVCNGHPTRREFYTREAKKLGIDPPEFSDEPTTTNKIVGNEKIKSELGYEFVYPDPDSMFKKR